MGPSSTSAKRRTGRARARPSTARRLVRRPPRTAHLRPALSVGADALSLPAWTSSSGYEQQFATQSVALTWTSQPSVRHYRLTPILNSQNVSGVAMIDVQATKGAKRIVEYCADVQPDEQVVIINDWNDSGAARLLAIKSKDRGATVNMMVLDRREHRGNEPGDAIVSGLLEADIIFQLTRPALVHTDAYETVMNETDARWFILPGLTTEKLIDGGLYADFDEMTPKAEKVAQLFSDASTAKVTSPQGTDIKFDLTGRQGKAVSGFARKPGTTAAPGNIEANIDPVEGSASGTVVVDGGVSDFGIGTLHEDIHLEIDDGLVNDISGGAYARMIDDILSEYDTPAVYNIGQLAVGMNPEVRVFSDDAVDLHGRYGNVHIGIGHSSGFLGGETRSPTHFDVMLSEPTLTLDGEPLLERGKNFIDL